MNITNISDIRHAFYINLDSRVDRNAHMQAQLRQVHLEGVCARFPAISIPSNGAIGCSLSHLRILQMASANQWPHVLIMEDDITFLNPPAFIRQFHAALEYKKNDWDVILFAGNVFNGFTPVHESLIQVNTCQTTTGYLVNGPYIPTLMANIKDGLTQLMHNPLNKRQFAIDRYWFRLQQADKWYLIVPLEVTQCPGYSNIECRNTDYSRVMLDLYT